MLFNYSKDNVKTVINMAWPSIVESFFVALAGLIDSYMVSSLGSTAVAAVGLTTQPKFLGLAAFFAMNVAVSALVARRVGEKKRREANEIMVTAVLIIVIAAILFSFFFVLLASPIISFCGSTEETHGMAVSYYKIIMGGMIFNCLQMGINAAQRGAGNTKITMRTNLTSNTLNVIFNYLLIGGHLGFPALGIKGAAIATVLGTVVACFMSIASVMKKDGFLYISYIISERIKASFTSVKQLINVGYSIFFEQILMRFGFMATSIMAAKLGTYEMAAHQVGMNILGLSFSFGDGLQAAAVALIGRSLGEKNKELAKEYGSICRTFGFIISCILAVIYFFGARPLMMSFFDEEECVSIGITIMRVVIIIVFFQISQVIYMGALRGAGDTAYTAKASIISVTVIRTIFSYLCCFVFGWGITGVWMGIVADQVSRFVFASIRFKAGKWTEIKI